jgi:hypothetical protein
MGNIMSKSKNNFVAKHLRKFNLAVVHVDKKKQSKKGYKKHQGQGDVKVAA